MRKQGFIYRQTMLPDKIDNTFVTEAGAPDLPLRGETYVTMRPVDNNDDRLWEYSLTTGRILRTR